MSSMSPPQWQVSPQSGHSCAIIVFSHGSTATPFLASSGFCSGGSAATPRLGELPAFNLGASVFRPGRSLACAPKFYDVGQGFPSLLVANLFTFDLSCQHAKGNNWFVTRKPPRRLRDRSCAFALGRLARADATADCDVRCLETQTAKDLAIPGRCVD